ncbi:MAG: LEA/WHy family protein [Planctomycetota bacterium]|jgi:LEA14-like dessication related protein
MHRAARAIAPLILILLLAGCAHKAPQLQVVGAEVVDGSEEATQIDFAIDLSNPNDEPLELLHFDYELSIDGQRVYQGRRAAEATLSRGGIRRLTIPVIVREADVPLRASADQSASTVAYRLSGQLLYISPGELAEILLDTGLRRPSVRFGSRGQIALGGEQPAVLPQR